MLGTRAEVTLEHSDGFWFRDGRSLGEAPGPQSPVRAAQGAVGRPPRGLVTGGPPQDSSVHNLEAEGRFPISARATCLLVQRFERRWKVYVHDNADVRAVDPHPKGVRGDKRGSPLFHEPALDPVPLHGGFTGVVLFRP